VIVDTDVFVCALALLRRDADRTAASRDFLLLAGDKWTTVFNALEAMGVACHHLAPADRTEFFSEFCSTFGVELWHPSWSLSTAVRDLDDPFWYGVAGVVARGSAFGDAVTIYCAELAQADQIVTWNLRHSRRCTDLPVLSPTEYLRRPE